MVTCKLLPPAKTCAGLLSSGRQRRPSWFAFNFDRVAGLCSPWNLAGLPSGDELNFQGEVFREHSRDRPVSSVHLLPSL